MQTFYSYRFLQTLNPIFLDFQKMDIEQYKFITLSWRFFIVSVEIRLNVDLG